MLKLIKYLQYQRHVKNCNWNIPCLQISAGMEALRRQQEFESESKMRMLTPKVISLLYGPVMALFLLPLNLISNQAAVLDYWVGAWFLSVNNCFCSQPGWDFQKLNILAANRKVFCERTQARSYSTGIFVFPLEYMC